MPTTLNTTYQTCLILPSGFCLHPTRESPPLRPYFSLTSTQSNPTKNPNLTNPLTTNNSILSVIQHQHRVVSLPSIPTVHSTQKNDFTTERIWCRAAHSSRRGPPQGNRWPNRNLNRVGGPPTRSRRCDLHRPSGLLRHRPSRLPRPRRRGNRPPPPQRILHQSHRGG